MPMTRTWILFMVFTAGCSSLDNELTWNVRQLATASSPSVSLTDRDGEVGAVLNTLTVKKILLAHLKVTRAAGVKAELFFIEGDQANAFAGQVRQGRFSSYGGTPIIALNLGMLKILDQDVDAVAAVLGHEAAHLSLNHGAERKRRKLGLQVIGALVELGAALGGVPVVGLGNMAVDLINAPYSRDEEREADNRGLDYLIAAGYDPMGAIRLEERLLDDMGAAQAVGEVLPFLSTHPSSSERIDNMIDRVQELGYYVPPKYLTRTRSLQSPADTAEDSPSTDASEVEENEYE